MKKHMISEEHVRMIKISKEALFEFIYEKFIDDADIFFDVNLLDVISSFDMDWENGQFIFCVHKSEDADGNIIPFPEEIDLQQVMKKIPDTTSSMYRKHRYHEYTKQELIALSKE